jgi:hypothetical protein
LCYPACSRHTQRARRMFGHLAVTERRLISSARIPRKDHRGREDRIGGRRVFRKGVRIPPANLDPEAGRSAGKPNPRSTFPVRGDGGRDEPSQSVGKTPPASAMLPLDAPPGTPRRGVPGNPIGRSVGMVTGMAMRVAPCSSLIAMAIARGKFVYLADHLILALPGVRHFDLVANRRDAGVLEGRGERK